MKPALAILAALAILLAACSSYEPESVKWEPPCGLVLSPDETTRAITESAAKRWSAATGCPVTVGEGGVPVLAVSPITTEDCEGACGCADVDGVNVVRVELDLERDGCAAPHTLAAHEIAHAMAPMSNPKHTRGGLMAEAAGNGSRIDEAALELVCSAHDCQTFTPEVERIQPADAAGSVGSQSFEKERDSRRKP